MLRSPGFKANLEEGLDCAYRKLHSAFQPNVMLRPYRLVSTVSVSSSRKSLISKAFAPDSIFGRDTLAMPSNRTRLARVHVSAE